MRRPPTDPTTARRGILRAGLVLGTVVVLVAAEAAWAGSVAQVLRTEIRVQRQTVRDLVRQLQDAQTQLEASWARVDRLALDLVRAQQQGEDPASLASRDADLRDAEGELMMRLFACQRIRASLGTIRARITSLRQEIQRLESGSGRGHDPISGRWRIVVDPGGLEGEMDLTLNGTLIDGTYHLQGGWTGSFRGTFVAGKVRLERVDSRQGFSSVFYGKLVPQDPLRLEGTWEGTHLSAGQPSGGTWMAEKLKEPRDNGGETGYPEP